jgi:hypothetical protein
LILIYPLGHNLYQYLTEYHTGELAAYSGSFKLPRHDLRFLKRLRKSNFSPKSTERRVPLSKGDPFPPCRNGNTNVIWNG